MRIRRAGPAHSRVLVVPDDSPTVQQAIDSAPDTILVRAGSYPERLELRPPSFDPILLMAHPETDPRGRPRLGALQILTDQVSAHLVFRGIHFTGQVLLHTSGGIDDLTFDHCTLDSGFVHASYDDIHDLSPFNVLGCRIGGRVVAVSGGACFRSDTIVGGGIEIGGLDGIALIEGCEFQGPGAVAIAANLLDLKGEILENRIEGFDVGIQVPMAKGCDISNNIVRGCRERGISIRGSGAIVRDNDVRGCGTGIDAYCLDGVYLRRNRVLESTGRGIQVLTEYGPAVLEGNVVGRSASDGVRVRIGTPYAGPARGVITNNTSYLNAGSGFEVQEGSWEFESFEVAGNIGFENGGPGLRWNAPQAATLSCNDWYGNRGGSTAGMDPGASDLMVHPNFCNVSRDSVELPADSPLLNHVPCGRIGALGLGCEGPSTEVLVPMLIASRVEGCVEVRWRLGGDERPVEVWLERSGLETSGWSWVATEQRADGDGTVMRDCGVDETSTYRYRLAWTTGRGEPGYSPSIEVPASGPGRTYALRVIGANPGSGPVTVEFTMPEPGPVGLAILDLQGRQVAQLARGTFEHGIHRVVWNGRAHAGELAPGIYFVRYRHRGGEHTRRLLLRR